MKGELDDRESVEDVRHFCRGLVEEAEARDQSCSEEGNGKGGQSSVRGGEERRGKERDAYVQHDGHIASSSFTESPLFSSLPLPPPCYISRPCSTATHVL